VCDDLSYKTEKAFNTENTEGTEKIMRKLDSAEIHA
jgi:hypothetical protein